MATVRSALFCLCAGILWFFVSPRPSFADSIENFSFSGTVSCTDAPACTNADVGNITGTFEVDAETGALDGPWTFTTVAGTVSSSEVGAIGTLSGDDLDIVASSFVLDLDFPAAVPFEGGNTVSGELVVPGQVLTVSGKATDPTGVPEPPTLSLLGIGLLTMAVAMRRKPLT